MAKEILCGFGIDVDAVAGWLGSYGGEDSPDDISRGLFAGEVGSPRLLSRLRRESVDIRPAAPAMPAARRSIKWSFPKLRELTIGKPPSLGRNSPSSVRW
jgi:hypothetical protein